jgi:hypothetical protein
MKIIATVLGNVLAAVFMVIGTLWGAFMALQTMVESKVAVAKDDLRIERTAQINTLETKLEGINTRVLSIDRKLDIIIGKEKK